MARKSNYTAEIWLKMYGSCIISGHMRFKAIAVLGLKISCEEGVIHNLFSLRVGGLVPLLKLVEWSSTEK